MATIDVLASAQLNLDHDGIGYRGATYGDLRKAGVPEAVVLSVVQDHLGSVVDAAAERLRASYLTPGVGQALEYQEVQAEAVAALASPSAANATLYPMLAATIGIDTDPTTKKPAADVLGVARAITAAAQQYVVIGAAIRSVRMKTKSAIEAATSVEAASAVVDGVTWPSSTSG